MTVELVTYPPSPKYARRKIIDLPTLLFDGLREAAREQKIRMTVSDRYRGGSDWLMLYGAGAPDRLEPMRRQLAAGGRVICWDAPYWQRGAKLRVSIDSLHPEAWVLRRNWPDARLIRDNPLIADRWDPAGPVLVAGIGWKSQAYYGKTAVTAWEEDLIAQALARWPGRPIWYRPKPNSPQAAPAGTTLTGTDPIQTLLQGVGLVVTWHSNVAVDAIRLGIPVVCRTGAAAAVCPGILPDEPQPLALGPRTQFLANLAWFQWAPSEGTGIWRFLRAILTG